MKTLIEIFDLEKKVNKLYDTMYKKYYNGDQLTEWHSIKYFGGGNTTKYKNKIKELLNKGLKVKTGYRTSKQIKGHKTYYIFYK